MKIMVRYLTVISLLFACSGITFGQFGLGIKGGLGTEWSNLKNDMENIHSGDAEYTYHFGAFLRLGGKNSIFVQPEFLWSNTTTTINFRDEASSEIRNDVLTTKLNKVDIPVMLGVNLIGKLINFQVGPVATYVIDEDSAVKFGDAFASYKDFTFGYQIGFGVNLGVLQLDLRYEGKASDISDQLVINGVDLDQRTSAIKASVAFRIF